MYIRFNTETKRVVFIGNSKPLNEETDLYKVAEYNGEIPQGDYLTVGNIQSLTRVVNPAHTETIINDEGKEEVVEIPEERETYLSCQVVGNKYTYTPEQIQAQKQAKYENLVENYIRERYTLSNELAILRQASTKVDEFNEYNTYAEQCKLRAREEVYGR